MANQTTVKIDTEILNLAKEMGQTIDYSAKQMVEHCVQAIAEMHNEAPSKRNIPKLVRLLDAAREHQKQPARFPPSAFSSVSLNETSSSETIEELAAKPGREAARKIAKFPGPGRKPSAASPTAHKPEPKPGADKDSGEE